MPLEVYHSNSSKRVPAKGQVQALQRQVTGSVVDRSYSTVSPGGRYWNSPVSCPFKIEPTADHLGLICGRTRASATYKWDDTILMPPSFVPITKHVAETVAIDNYTYGWVGYRVDFRWNTATLEWWNASSSAPFYCDNYSMTVILAKVTCETIGGINYVKSVTQEHFGLIDCRGWHQRYFGPFDVWYYGAGAYSNQVEVGHTRTYGPFWGQRFDRIVVHPDVILQGYPEIAIVCNGDGYIVKRIVREATISADASKWVSAVPGNTATEYYAVLAQVKWDYPNSRIGEIMQHQHGDIVIDRTTVNYCP